MAIPRSSVSCVARVREQRVGVIVIDAAERLRWDVIALMVVVAAACFLAFCSRLTKPLLALDLFPPPFSLPPLVLVLDPDLVFTFIWSLLLHPDTRLPTSRRRLDCRRIFTQISCLFEPTTLQPVFNTCLDYYSLCKL
jgi:hypothetical protein